MSSLLCCVRKSVFPKIKESWFSVNGIFPLFHQTLTLHAVIFFYNIGNKHTVSTREGRVKRRSDLILLLSLRVSMGNEAISSATLSSGDLRSRLRPSYQQQKVIPPAGPVHSGNKVPEQGRAHFKPCCEFVVRISLYVPDPYILYLEGDPAHLHINDLIRVVVFE